MKYVVLICIECRAGSIPNILNVFYLVKTDYHFKGATLTCKVHYLALSHLFVIISNK